MRLAPEGIPFLAAGLVLALAAWAVAAVLGGPWSVAVAALLTVLALFVGWFFRDPRRPLPADPTLVLAPADGRIVDIAEVDESSYLTGRCRRVSIFLSIFNVHVQRSPVTGRVEHRDRKPGGYAIAWKPKASEENEQASVGIRAGAGRVLVRQIAGLVARRIVTDPVPGDTVERGERIGLIRFGSRVDTFFPLEWEVTCRKGQIARTGVTPLARMPEGGAE